MKLTKRTTLLFDPELWSQLEQLAEVEHTSVSELIRKAVVDRYSLVRKERRIAAVEAMRKMKGPVADWETMEREIAEGMLGHRCPNP